LVVVVMGKRLEQQNTVEALHGYIVIIITLGYNNGLNFEMSHNAARKSRNAKNILVWRSSDL